MEIVLNADEIIRLLGLVPHPEEGGYFVQTYKSPEYVPADALPPGYAGQRATGTAIYYLLTPQTFSHLHRLKSDEIFHFYLGDGVEMLQLFRDGKGEIIRMGSNLAKGERPQVVVPRGVWQGARLVPGGGFALLGCTVAPGFEYEDYEHAGRRDLLRRYPRFADMIELLTNDV